ncbi:MAG: polyprenyl synthetase family protein [Saprospiraceae bacterium]|jgi:octaprenyl-diphosphate synthase|nr:polyprenyl synthetase family protein [Saprospiraceae bacterium]MBP6236922.1 polyprenyl synthetase family protein [Saprospiraceae bacterium]MBP6568623.1 polyprenyl synthetase family protein [Saprospiraceae bacterium]
MASELDKIKNPVGKELKEFEKHFKNSMKSSVPLLDKITYYIVQKKGKQVRPILVFLCAKLCGEINDSTNVAASLIELSHTASLVHDDVVDDAYERRGFFSINALWKNKIAVLVGDFLLTKGLQIALETKNYRHLETVSTAVQQMSEGELLQMEKARKLDIDESIYFEIIRQKTASLIAAACSAGASSTTDNEEWISKMRQFGEKVGIAFQIKDDLFDYGDFDIGKPRGIDIKEKKMTLPLIYSLNKSEKVLRNKIINYIKTDSKNEEKVKEVISFVKSMGGLEYAEKIMIKYQNEAIEILKTFPESEARNSLENLVFFFTSRKN